MIIECRHPSCRWHLKSDALSILSALQVLLLWWRVQVRLHNQPERCTSCKFAETSGPSCGTASPSRMPGGIRSHTISPHVTSACTRAPPSLVLPSAPHPYYGCERSTLRGRSRICATPS